MEQRNKVGCVISPQGAMSVVQDLINTTRQMKEQLGPTLIRETQLRMEEREVTGTRWEIEKIEERLHEKDGVGDEHTHIEVVEDHEGELADCLETRCEQLDSLLRERGEVVCPLEAIHDQVGSVVPSEVEGTSAVDRCTESLGGIEAPGTLVGTRIPSVIVPVCVVKGVSAPPCVSGVVASVPGCVRASQHAVCERGTASGRGRVCEGNGTRVRTAVCE